MICFRFCTIVLSVLLVNGIGSVSDFPKLVVVSFDGFRYDYLDGDLTPFLNSLKEKSSFGRSMKSVFPTQTFPNHFSIATGLYTEVHGVLASRVYDSEERRTLRYGYSLFHYNDDIVPIWTLNELTGGGRHSGVMMWPGSNFAYRGINATFIVEYDLKMNWELRVDKVIEWMTDPTTPANLVMMYFEEPDRHCHAFGPDSKETRHQIARADNIARYLFESLDRAQLPDVNVIFLSDHGIEKTFKRNIVDLNQLVGDQCTMYGSSPVLQVHPNEGVDVEEVYMKLKEEATANDSFMVYRREEIPDHLHYKNCRRAPPILVVSKRGYVFQDMYESIEKYRKNFNASRENTFGEHGYDPAMSSMHSFFMAVGPSFKTNYKARNHFEVIDMFAVFSRVLELEPPPVQPNATYDRVAEIFFMSSLPLELILQSIAIAALGIYIVDLVLYCRR